MAGSATDAISHAVERSKQVLFPFKPEKWFALGFTVFLAQFMELNFSAVSGPRLPFGGMPSLPTPSHGGPPSGASGMQEFFDELLRKLNSDLGFYIGFAIGGMVLSIAVSVVVLWISSRAKLMLVESVVWDRVELGQQWTRAADLGMSLFKFRLWMMLAGYALTCTGLAVAVFVGLSDFRGGNIFGSHALMGYAVFGLATLLVGFPLSVAMLLLDDFVVPLMVVRNVKVGEAWRMCRDEVLSGNVGELVVFYVLRFVLSLGFAILLTVLACMTCCLSTLPYLGTVLILPAFVFWRAFPLYFMEQLGLRIFPAPEPSWQAYDQWRFPT